MGMWGASRGGFQRGAAAAAVVLVAAACAVAAAWVHFPGHVSMDSSMQLWEAWLGESVTWNPPSMSAMLRWLGPGAEGAGRMMALNTVATYLALAGTGAVMLLVRAGASRKWGWIAAGLVALVVLNPILFLYVGIVWKDVLFSTLMLAGAALGLVACILEGRGKWVAALASVVVLAFGMKVRQQGIFVAPTLALVPVIAVAWGASGRSTAARNAALVLLVFVASAWSASRMVAATIHTPPQFGNQVGLQGVMQYDTSGIVAFSTTPTDAFPIPMNDRLRAEVQRVYSVDRGDFQWTSPAVTQWLSAPGYAGVKQRWRTLVANEPGAYLAHKLGAFRSLMNVDGVKACLPIHVGMVGHDENLRQIGIEPGLDRHDQRIYGWSQRIIRWPLYRHWVYAVALLVAGVVVMAGLRRSRLKWGLVAVGVATALLYASYLPTSIACDFRYLFPAICLVSLVWIVLVVELTGPGSRWAGKHE